MAATVSRLGQICKHQPGQWSNDQLWNGLNQSKSNNFKVCGKTLKLLFSALAKIPIAYIWTFLFVMVTKKWTSSRAKNIGFIQRSTHVCISAGNMPGLNDPHLLIHSVLYTYSSLLLSVLWLPQVAAGGTSCCTLRKEILMLVLCNCFMVTLLFKIVFFMQNTDGFYCI